MASRLAVVFLLLLITVVCGIAHFYFIPIAFTKEDLIIVAFAIASFSLASIILFQFISKYNNDSNLQKVRLSANTKDVPSYSQKVVYTGPFVSANGTLNSGGEVAAVKELL